MDLEDDIVEMLLEELRPAPGTRDFRNELEKEVPRTGQWGFFLKDPFNRGKTNLPARRLFFSEYEIKKLLSGGKKKCVLPSSAIVSPLAEEWIQEKGIQIVFE
ncbi:MAG: hypothetical protein HYY63_00280 [Elusimicrobia bacterium]|nr:hypothetical protein [Elusimicrobiota bacterium]